MKVREEELSVLVNSTCKGPEAEGNLGCMALKRGQRQQWPAHTGSFGKEKLRVSRDRIWSDLHFQCSALPGSPERPGPGHSSKNSTLDPAKQVCVFLFFFSLQGVMPLPG